MPFLPLLPTINTSLSVFSDSDCADVFPSLSLIGKSHWRCKTAYELWLQKREKFSSERLRSGQSICTLTGEILASGGFDLCCCVSEFLDTNKVLGVIDNGTTLMFLCLLFVEKPSSKIGDSLHQEKLMPQPGLVSSGLFIHEFCFFIKIHSRQCLSLKNISFPCWLNACNLWSPTVAAWMGGSSVRAFVLKWHHHKDILYWGSS